MPIINVTAIENVFTADQKQEIVEKLTAAMVSVEGENLQGATWVIINEVKSGDVGIGGKILTTEDVHRMQKGVPA